MRVRVMDVLIALQPLDIVVCVIALDRIFHPLYLTRVSKL